MGKYSKLLKNYYAELIELFYLYLKEKDKKKVCEKLNNIEIILTSKDLDRLIELSYRFLKIKSKKNKKYKVLFELVSNAKKEKEEIIKDLGSLDCNKEQSSVLNKLNLLISKGKLLLILPFLITTISCGGGSGRGQHMDNINENDIGITLDGSSFNNTNQSDNFDSYLNFLYSIDNATDLDEKIYKIFSFLANNRQSFYNILSVYDKTEEICENVLNESSNSSIVQFNEQLEVFNNRINLKMFFVHSSNDVQWDNYGVNNPHEDVLGFYLTGRYKIFILLDHTRDLSLTLDSTEHELYHFYQDVYEKLFTIVYNQNILMRFFNKYRYTRLSEYINNKVTEIQIIISKKNLSLFNALQQYLDNFNTIHHILHPVLSSSEMDLFYKINDVLEGISTILNNIKESGSLDSLFLALINNNELVNRINNFLYYSNEIFNNLSPFLREEYQQLLILFQTSSFSITNFFQSINNKTIFIEATLKFLKDVAIYYLNSYANQTQSYGYNNKEINRLIKKLEENYNLIEKNMNWLKKFNHYDLFIQSYLTIIPKILIETSARTFEKIAAPLGEGINGLLDDDKKKLALYLIRTFNTILEERMKDPSFVDQLIFSPDINRLLRKEPYILGNIIAQKFIEKYGKLYYADALDVVTTFNLILAVEIDEMLDNILNKIRNS
ncbi:MAG: hypothetical protein ABGW69_03450 [Nanoarchaeota archaeon]